MAHFPGPCATQTFGALGPHEGGRQVADQLPSIHTQKHAIVDQLRRHVGQHVDEAEAEVTAQGAIPGEAEGAETRETGRVAVQYTASRSSVEDRRCSSERASSMDTPA